MLLLAIGLGAVGFMALRRAHCRAHGGGRCGGRGHGRHHHGHHGWHGRHGGRRRWIVDMALERIDASPAQERAIIAELDQLEERLHGARRGLRDLRGPLADAVAGSELDEGALAGVLHGVDQASGEARAAVVEALRKIHALLDDKQRAQLGALLGRGAARGAPYRT